MPHSAVFSISTKNLGGGGIRALPAIFPAVFPALPAVFKTCSKCLAVSMTLRKTKTTCNMIAMITSHMRDVTDLDVSELLYDEGRWYTYAKFHRRSFVGLRINLTSYGQNIFFLVVP